MGSLSGSRVLLTSKHRMHQFANLRCRKTMVNHQTNSKKPRHDFIRESMLTSFVLVPSNSCSFLSCQQSWLHLSAVNSEQDCLCHQLDIGFFPDDIGSCEQQCCNTINASVFVFYRLTTFRNNNVLTRGVPGMSLVSTLGCQKTLKTLPRLKGTMCRKLFSLRT